MTVTRFTRRQSAWRVTYPYARAFLLGAVVVAGIGCARPQADESLGTQSSAIVGQWATTATSLQIARSAFSSNAYALGLPNGDVLFAGGNFGSGTTNSSVDLFGQAGFAPQPSFAKARASAGAIVGDDGSAFLIGGGYLQTLSNVIAESNIDRWRPGIGWQALSPLQAARFGPSVTRLSDGRIVIAGGLSQSASTVVEISSAEIFNPVTGLSALATGALASGRSGHTGALLANGKVAVIGSGVAGVALPIQVFDPVTQAFASGPTTLAPRFLHASARLADGRVLTCGGCTAPLLCGGTALNSCEIFDGTTVTATGSMTQASGMHAMITLPSKKVLAVGGTSAGTTLSRAELYDPDTGVWTPTGSLAVGRYETGIALLSDGRVLVAGGRSGPTASGSTYYASGEVFDPGVAIVCKVQQINGTTNTLADGTPCASGTCQAGVCTPVDAGADAAAEASTDATSDAPVVVVDAAADASDATADATADAAVDAPIGVVDAAADVSDAVAPIDSSDAPVATPDAAPDTGVATVDAGPTTPVVDSGPSTPAPTPPADEGGCQTTPRPSPSSTPVVAIVFALLAACGLRSRKASAVVGVSLRRSLACAIAFVAGCQSQAPGSTPTPPTASVPTSTPTTAPGTATLRYSPTCKPGCPDPNCLGGNEVQALTWFQGTLFAGVSNWMETESCVYPKRNAQVLEWSPSTNTWSAPHPLPGECAPGIANTQEINSFTIHRRGEGASASETLFASTMPTDAEKLDGGATPLCPTINFGTVYLRAADGSWVDTGLGKLLATGYEQLATVYKQTPWNMEVRYVVAHSDGTDDCPSTRPCLFAAVGQQAHINSYTATVWRGVVDPTKCGAGTVCWDAKPELSLDGKSYPTATRVLTMHDAGPYGLVIGTGVPKAGDEGAGKGQLRTSQCASPDDLNCHRPSLLRRSPDTRKWSTLWRGHRADESDVRTRELELRGIATWPAQSKTPEMWFILNTSGRVMHADTANPTADFATTEATLSDMLPATCKQAFYGYRILLDPNASGSSPALYVSSQACWDQVHVGGLFVRGLDRCRDWRALKLEGVTNPEANWNNAGPNQAALRWVEVNQTKPGNVLVGTTDMNSHAGSLTGRIFEVERPLDAVCSP